MANQESAATQFLTQLYTLTQGDLTAQQSMHDVGAALGWDKEQSGKIAETLIGEGLVEIKTLSGGVGITTEGVEAVRASGTPPQGASDLSLGSGTLIETEGRSTVDHLLAQMKAPIAQSQSPYAQLEEMVIDIKTIETHLLSPQPKVAVIRELLRSLQATFSKTGLTDIASMIKKVINDPS